MGGVDFRGWGISVGLPNSSRLPTPGKRWSRCHGNPKPTFLEWCKSGEAMPRLEGINEVITDEEIW